MYLDMISVIMPAYNAEKYISDAIDSVLNQSYQNFEIIIVDDGSKDGTGEICDYYRDRYDKVKVIHQDNAGVSGARNTGLKNIKGKYVVFLDADDTLEKSVFQSMIHKIKDNDLLIGGIKEMNMDGMLLSEVCLLPEKDISARLMLYYLFHEEHYGYLGYLGGKMFRTNIIRDNKLIFNSRIKYNEDRLFITEYLLYCEKNIKFISDMILHYRQSDTSAIGRIRKNYRSDALTELDAFEIMKRLVIDSEPDLYSYICKLTFGKGLFWLRRIPKADRADCKKCRKIVRANARQMLRDRYSIREKIKIIGHVILER